MTKDLAYQQSIIKQENRERKGEMVWESYYVTYKIGIFWRHLGSARSREVWFRINKIG